MTARKRCVGSERTNTHDVEAEMWAAYRNLDAAQRSWLLNELGEGCYLKFGPFGVCGGKITMPLRVWDKVLDLISWPASEPNIFTAQNGSDLFGVEAFAAALDSDSPLAVFRTPWALLKFASKDPWITERIAPPGAVVLSAGAWYGIFAKITELVCEDRAHAEQLDASIRRSGKQSPPIVWPEREGLGA